MDFSTILLYEFEGITSNDECIEIHNVLRKIINEKNEEDIINNFFEGEKGFYEIFLKDFTNRIIDDILNKEHKNASFSLKLGGKNIYQHSIYILFDYLNIMTKFLLRDDFKNNLNGKIFNLIPKIKEILNCKSFFYKNGSYDAENFNDYYLKKKR